MLPQCRALASNHVDLMFHAFCQLGHGVGLDAAAKGMGLAGKLEGMKGAKAPIMWAEGKREEVLRYVGQDVRTTLEVALKCEALGSLRWIARSGNLRSMALPKGWLTVVGGWEIARSRYLVDVRSVVAVGVHGVDAVASQRSSRSATLPLCRF